MSTEISINQEQSNNIKSLKIEVSSQEIIFYHNKNINDFNNYVNTIIKEGKINRGTAHVLWTPERILKAFLLLYPVYNNTLLLPENINYKKTRIEFLIDNSFIYSTTINLVFKGYLYNKCLFLNPQLNSDKLSYFNSMIEKCKKKFNNEFDYSKSIYINSETPITIISKYGEFNMKLNNHYKSKYGYPLNFLSLDQKKSLKASGIRISTEDFIKRCKEKYGESTYDYSKIEYNGQTERIEVVCYVHGSFYPFAGNFLNGHGCKYCSKNRVASSQKKRYK